MDEEIKAGVFVLDAMVESYVSGDVSTLWEMLEESLLMEGDNSKQNELGEKLLNLVLYERNELMVDRFELLVKANPNRKNFVAVGVAHLLGEKSVIEGLQEAGFKVSRVTE